MRMVVLSVVLVCVGVLALEAEAPIARTLRWDDLPVPIARRLGAAGLDARAFPAFLEEQERLTQERVRESDLDALIYYALQSVVFTEAPPIEPALSAKAFVEGHDVPVEVRERLARLIPALHHPAPGTRLAYFHDLVARETNTEQMEAFLLQQYARAARFLYEKEFVAPARPDGVDAIAALYRQRALSTDTSVEAGYLVHLGVATVRATYPERRMRRVLIVGPGLELAPRTGLLELGPPQSYQPYAILDSLVALGLARIGDVTVVCADVNPRVVEHLQAANERQVDLTLVSGIGDSGTTKLEDDYRRYFDGLGQSIGRVTAAPVLPAVRRGHLVKALRVPPDATRAIGAIRLDVVRQRLAAEPFDLIVATNVLLYFDDVTLTLALANIASMLAPGGVLIHNEARALVGNVTAEQHMPIVHARTAQLAEVRGAAAPLYDSVFVHVKDR